MRADGRRLARPGAPTEALASVPQWAAATVLDGLVLFVPVLAVVLRFSRVDGDEVVLERRCG